jgi:DNA (cytosine-5)-methyltransferase 1
VVLGHETTEVGIVMRPLLLDLFCCEGGAARGYHDAGWSPIGVDIEVQPNYPYDCHEGDALTFPVWDCISAIHASPPCQAYTTMTNRRARPSSELELIDVVREKLEATGLPYVIENVVGARRHMRNPLMLHGGMFGLNVYRPRLFESNVLLMAPPKAPRPKDAAAVYGRREDRRLLWKRADGTELRAASLEEARAAMEMPWASWNGVREAIPPAYTRWIGEQLLNHVREAAA